MVTDWVLGEKSRSYRVSDRLDSVTRCLRYTDRSGGAAWARGSLRGWPGYTSLLRLKQGQVETTWFTTLDTAAGEVNHSGRRSAERKRGVVVVTFTGTNGVSDSLSYAIAVAEVHGKAPRHRNDAKYARYVAPGYLLYVTTTKTLMVTPSIRMHEVTGARHGDRGMRLQVRIGGPRGFGRWNSGVWTGGDRTSVRLYG